MKKIRIFIKDFKTEGLKYALAKSLMFTFQDSKIKFLRRFSDRCYDFAYDIYEKSHPLSSAEDEECEWEPIRTPCGCTLFDCDECGSYPVCSQYQDIDPLVSGNA